MAGIWVRGWVDVDQVALEMKSGWVRRASVKVVPSTETGKMRISVGGGAGC